jgi:hypothetical protein
MPVGVRTVAPAGTGRCAPYQVRDLVTLVAAARRPADMASGYSQVGVVDA